MKIELPNLTTRTLLSGGLGALLALVAGASAHATGTPAYNTIINFDDPVPLAESQEAGKWYPDRYRPAAFETHSFGGENVLKLSIAPADGAQNRPSGYSSGFYNTQGRKFDLPSGTFALSAKLYFPSSWTGDVRRRSDLWATAVDATNAISFYPIAGIANNDATPVIRYWDGADWVNTTITPVADTWYQFDLQLSDSNLVVKVNGQEVAEIDSNGSVALRDVIIQAYNYNDSTLLALQSADAYDAYWDDLSYAYPEIRNETQDTLHSTLADAVANAQPNDVINMAGGNYNEPPVNINKALTINGANAGLAGVDPGRALESRIANTPLIITAAGVVIDGVEIYQTNDTADAVLVQAAATVRNSVISRFAATEHVPPNSVFSRGITTAVGTTGYSISGNLFTGDPFGGFFGGHKTWNSGIYLNGGSGSITGNTFENCRTAINADDFNAGITITGNTFRTSGTYLAFGGTTPTDGQYTIAGNEFFIDWIDPVTNWLPSALFNNSNVAATFRIDATGNTFGGVATTALSNDQKFAIEARNFHRGRSNRNGVVDFVADQQVVMLPTASYTIANAINAAAASDSVLVGPGTYAESLTLSMPLALLGANVGVDAVTGSRVAETILEGGITVTSDDVTIDGLTISNPAGTTGIYAIRCSGLTVANNIIHSINTSGTGSAAGLYVLGDNSTTGSIPLQDINVTGNHIHMIGSLSATISTKGIYFGDSNGISTISNILIQGNRVENVSTTKGAYGITLNYGYNSTGTVDGLQILGNTVSNLEGLWVHGIGLETTTTNTVVSENDLSDLRDNKVPSDAVGIFFEGNPAGDTVTISRNILRSDMGWGVAIHPNDLSAYGYIVDASANYWDAANGPAGEGTGDGTPVAPSVTFSPWYADEARTILVTAANFQDVTIPAGSSVTETDLFIGAGATYTVLGSLAVTGDLTLTDGAVLEVINGSLTINGSTLSGSFTFFNSLGSINFNDDVSITGSAEGLILISDVHVADGATITVDGTLVIDGCVVDSTGNFDLVVNSGAKFTMARTVFADGDITVNSADTAIYDNRFETSTIAVGAGAAAARIYHNLTDSLGWLSGAAVTTVDGWGNVTDAAQTQNNLALGLDISILPADRTQDVDGNVFIQPEDSVFATLDVSDLQAKIAGVEVMLGYNTSLIDVATLGLAPDWDVLIYDNQDDSTAIGLLDAAIGLSFDFLDPAGSDADQTIGDVELLAGLDEGETLFFHRVKLASDVFGGETRLTTGGASPAFLTPFTSNSSMITIDGTVPLIADPTVYATIEQFNDDVNTVTTSTAVTIQGDVDITAAAFDALAGIEDAKAEVTLVGPATYTATQTGISAGPTIPTIGGDDYTTYAYTYTVDATTLNGTYDVVFTVTDRSGNQTVETLGSILINKNQVVVNVELEGLAAGPLNRDVVLVFTDIGGNLIETRTEAIEFTGGVGSVALTDVDDASYRLSAKTAWNLRKRLDVELDSGGQAVVDFTGTNELPGGDINGGIPGDNVVNTLDYSVLRFHWFKDVTLVPAAAVADINGDGVINATDYAILQSNFYQAGDPQ